MVAARSYPLVGALSLIYNVAHTDPSLDFFEVAWPVKYKKRFSHYLNQKVIYTLEQDDAPPTIMTNADLIQEGSKSESEGEESAPPKLKYKRTILTLNQVKLSQEKIRSYPPILLHTLFHEDSKYDKYRQAEFSNLFFFADDIKSKGNEAYH